MPLQLSTFCFSAGPTASWTLAKSSTFEFLSLDAEPESCPISENATARKHCHERFGLKVARSALKVGQRAMTRGD